LTKHLHKRWSMWFNSMQHENPHQGLTCFKFSWNFLKEKNALDNADIGGAWLSLARVVKCWVKSHNEHLKLSQENWYTCSIGWNFWIRLHYAKIKWCPNSRWMLAACLTHASQMKSILVVLSVADRWVLCKNLSLGREQQLEMGNLLESKTMWWSIKRVNIFLNISITIINIFWKK